MGLGRFDSTKRVFNPASSLAPPRNSTFLKKFLNRVFFMVSKLTTARTALKIKGFSGSFTIEWE